MTTGGRDRRTGGTPRPGVGIVAVLLVALALAWMQALRWAGFEQVLLSQWGFSVGLFCGLVTFVIAAFVKGRRSAAFLVGLALAALFLAGPFVGFFLLLSMKIGLAGLVAVLEAWGETTREGLGERIFFWLVHGTLAALFFLVQAFAILRACAAWKGR